MRRFPLIGILIGTLAVTACGFENSSNLLVPTAPGNVSGAAGTTGTGTSGGSSGGSTSSGGGSSTSGGSGSTAALTAFTGAWSSSAINGLPLGNCSNVRWVITAQTTTSISGTVNATCDSGIVVNANLTGNMVNDNTINLSGNGTLTAMGVPCQFNITGTGTRQTNDSMKVDYTGSYCFGPISGTEILRKFPDV